MKHPENTERAGLGSHRRTPDPEQHFSAAGTEYIDEMDRELGSSVDYYSTNAVTFPPYYQPGNLPLEVKKATLAKLTEAMHGYETRITVTSAIMPVSRCSPLILTKSIGIHSASTSPRLICWKASTLAK